ncbi:MAG: hypothetical protein GXY20_11480 [Clostridiales bacterium]|nr:hypothetical protein [Clostridiales bacterium]
MKVFEKPGKQNTDETCRIAVERAKLINAPIIAATTEGVSGLRVCQIAEELGFTGQIVIVASAYGAHAPGESLLKDEYRDAIKARGVQIVAAAHALSGAERGMSTKFKGIYPLEIMAYTLRILSQGVKVAVEIGSMALDAGAVAHGIPVVVMGGTSRGLDTAVVMSPAHANAIFDSNIHEILCMPY